MNILQSIKSEDFSEKDSYEYIVKIAQEVEKSGYTVAELNHSKPWGGYIRIDNRQADRFVKDFFPNLSIQQARLGLKAEISPKLLIVLPGHRLSWQYHHRRAEIWRFLTPGGYHKSLTDEQEELIEADTDERVEFMQGERHRLVGGRHGFTVVAEIWQHTDPAHPSDEDDIIRLQDDYSRK